MATTVFDNVGGPVAAPVAGAPTNVRVTATTSSTATLSWTAPSYAGTSAITDYQVTASPASVMSPATQNVGSSATTKTVTGISPSVPVTFSVVAINGSGAGTPAAAPSVTLVPAVANPKANTLTDTFDGTTLDASKWATTGAAPVVNGDLELPAALGLTAGIVSQGVYDLRESNFGVFVQPGPSANDQGYVEVRNSADATTLLRATVSGATVTAYSVVAGAITQLGSAGFTGAVWVRLRETAGRTYVETSADGLSWPTQVASLTSPTWLNAVKLALSAGSV